jgi:SAM-dependent methyltransferase
MLGAPNHCSCGASRVPTRLFEIASRTSSARTTLLRCPACGSLFPEALPALAEAERQYDMGPRTRAGWRRFARRLVDLTRGRYVDRAIPAEAKRVLDFGCGAGVYLESMVATGREAFGVDPVRPGDAARTWRWIEIDAMEQFAPFDWITLGHVLEHLADPSAVLSRLTSLTAPGGGLWLATPNAASFIFAVAQDAARDVDYPRHREVFARDGLEHLLAAAGLDVAWVSPPRVNAVLNVATTARQILSGPGLSPAHRLLALVRTGLALLRHVLKSRRHRDAESPELIAICTLRPADPFQAR